MVLGTTLTLTMAHGIILISTTVLGEVKPALGTTTLLKTPHGVIMAITSRFQHRQILALS